MNILHDKLTYWDKDVVPYDGRFKDMTLDDFLQVQEKVENIIRTLIIQIYRLRTLITLSDSLMNVMNNLLVYTIKDGETELHKEPKLLMDSVKNVDKLINTVISEYNAIVVQSDKLASKRFITIRFTGQRGEVVFIPTVEDADKKAGRAAVLKFSDNAYKLALDFDNFKMIEESQIKRLYSCTTCDTAFYSFSQNCVSKYETSRRGGQVFFEHGFNETPIGPVLCRDDMRDADYVFNESLSGAADEFPKRVLASFPGFEFFEISQYFSVYYPEVHNTLEQLIPDMQGILDEMSQHYEEIESLIDGVPVFVSEGYGTITLPKKLNEYQPYSDIIKFLKYCTENRIEEVKNDPTDYQ